MQNSCDGSVVITKVGIVNTNITIKNGKIKDISKSLNNISYSKLIDAAGKYILHGLIDPYVHYSVYTPIEKAARRGKICSSSWSYDNIKNVQMNEIQNRNYLI